MYTNGQMINYDKYQEALHKLPAPILLDNCRMCRLILRHL